MEMQAFQYTKDGGWSIPAFPSLDSDNTWVLVFGAPCFLKDWSPLQDLSKAFPHSKIMGCSSAGEIFGGAIVDNSLSVVVVKFIHTQLKIAKRQVKKPDDSEKMGIELARELEGAGLKSIFVLSDGLHVNGTQLVQGLNVGLSQKEVIISGGLAGDGSDFKKTWVLLNGKLLDKHVVAIGFYGEHLQVGHASRGGWDIFGPVRRVTRSEANILFELDYKPALELYKEYLGEKAAFLPSSGLLYPLAINDGTSGNHTQLVRTILGIDEKKHALIFAGDIPLGWHAQLMRANFDRLIDSASEAGDVAASQLDKNLPILSIDISCIGRRLLLGERTEEEVEATFATLPKNSIQIGFYSYGELSPFHLGKCEFHNQTMTITSYVESC